MLFSKSKDVFPGTVPMHIQNKLNTMSPWYSSYQFLYALDFRVQIFIRSISLELSIEINTD